MVCNKEFSNVSELLHVYLGVRSEVPDEIKGKLILTHACYPLENCYHPVSFPHFWTSIYTKQWPLQLKRITLWDVTPCSLVEVCCQHSGYSDGLRAGRAEFDSRQRQQVFLFSTASRPALALTQPAIQWVREALSPGAKRPGLETDHSPPSAEVKNSDTIRPLPRRVHGVVFN
jgi:hypothetical protein